MVIVLKDFKLFIHNLLKISPDSQVCVESRPKFGVSLIMSPEI